MNPIRVEKAKGCRIEHNSMLEKDLSRPVNLNNLYHTPKAARLKKECGMEIPDYMGRDFDVESSALYRHLCNIRTIRLVR